MDRETDIKKIGGYNFYFWKKARGKEVLSIMKVVAGAKSYNQKGMVEAGMDNFEMLSSLVCSKVLDGEKEVGIKVADDFEAPDYVEFFEEVSKRVTEIVKGMDKKKVKK